MVPNYAVFSSFREPVGDRSDQCVLLSLTKQGVIERNLDGGGKFPSSFDTYQIVYPGQMVFCLFDIDETPRTVGLSSKHGMITGAYDVFDLRDSVCDPRYVLYYYLTVDEGKHLRPYYRSLRKTLTSSMFRHVKMPLPPLPEQQHIANFLDERCAVIDETQQAIVDEIDALQRLRKATIHKAVTQGLDEGVPMRDSGVEWIGLIPMHWKVSQVKRVYSVTLGKMVEKAIDSIGQPTERYLCAANIGWRGIRTAIHREMPFSEAEKKAYAVRSGDVVVMEGGATAGTTCVYRGEFGDETYMQNSVLSCRKRRGGLNVYLAYWMELVYSSGYRDASCNAATFAHYTKDKLETTPILIMPDDEEHRIIEYLDERCAAIDSVIETRTKQIERLDDYRRALVFAYVTGKKEVPSHE